MHSEATSPPPAPRKEQKGARGQEGLVRAAPLTLPVHENHQRVLENATSDQQIWGAPEAAFLSSSRVSDSDAAGPGTTLGTGRIQREITSL